MNVNARWQQAFTVVVWVMLIVGPFWWGLAAVVGLVAGVLGLQFALMHRANRRDPAPRALLGAVVRAWARELWVAVRVFCWQQPWRHGAEPDWLPPRDPAATSTPRPVVLVHGFLCNRGLWNDWMSRLRARGHAYVAVNLEPALGSIDAYVETIDAAVSAVQQATGQLPVLVCHSMGGLAARAWLRAVPDAPQRVHRVLTLGTPHQGTMLGRAGWAVNGQQMCWRSPWIEALAQAEPPERGRLFVCWYSNCDNIVFPASTAALPGADAPRFVEGLAHVELVFDEAVIAACLDEIGAA